MKLRPIDSIVSTAEKVDVKVLHELVDLLEKETKAIKADYRMYNRKDFQIGVRVTAEEYAYIQGQARKMQVSMSAVVRYMMLVCMQVLEKENK